MLLFTHKALNLTPFFEQRFAADLKCDEKLEHQNIINTNNIKGIFGNECAVGVCSNTDCFNATTNVASHSTDKYNLQTCWCSWINRDNTISKISAKCFLMLI